MPYLWPCVLSSTEIRQTAGMVVGSETNTGFSKLQGVRERSQGVYSVENGIFLNELVSVLDIIFSEFF